MYFFLENTAVLTVFSFLSITIVQSNDQCDCGLLNVQSRISHGRKVGDHEYSWIPFINRKYHGSNTDNHKYPWVAFIKTFRNGMSYECTGSLVDDRTVLTAAHCVENKDESYVQPSQLMVFLGITTKKDAHHEIGRQVEAIFVHPERNVTLFENDIALLRLKNPVKFVKNIRPICLPEGRGESVFGKMKVAGFGRLSVEKEASDLQEADIHFVDRNTCYNKLARFFKNPIIFPKTAFCGKGKGKTMICGGDSGGPLMHSNKEGKMVIAGVSQFIKKPCGDGADISDFYVNVGLFIDFIEKHASSPCFVPLI